MLKNLLDSFSFKSREQQEREQQEFEGRVFPLGMGQRAAAAAVLARLLPGIKRETDRLYAYIAAKDAYLLARDAWQRQAAALRVLRSVRWRDEQNIRVVLALIRLEAGIPSLEEYPTPDAVLQEAGQIDL